MGRLALLKGEGEGEGLFEKLARAGGEPLTLVLSPSPRGEAREIGPGLLCIAVVIGVTARGKRSFLRLLTRATPSTTSKASKPKLTCNPWNPVSVKNVVAKRSKPTVTPL